MPANKEQSNTSLPEQEDKAAPASGEAQKQEPESNIAQPINEWEERFLRLTAEYQNHRVRTQKEKESLGLDVIAQTAAQFLVVLDNLERALENKTEDKNYAKGIEMIHKQMLDILIKMKITEIDAQGGQFDPKYMEAAMHTEDENAAENTVVRVFAKGYRMEDRILRHAVVQVAN
ncbi:MAG: nucleotide exchange factor GrpE [Oscillospiraceae bacterium]|nr:nucleotide exchange factor GrpE [Oscillospiraceae bacterium]